MSEGSLSHRTRSALSRVGPSALDRARLISVVPERAVNRKETFRNPGELFVSSNAAISLV